MPMHTHTRVHARIVSLCALALAACPAPGGDDDGGEATGGIVTVSTSSGDASTTTSTGESSTTTTGEPPAPTCTDDAECEEGYTCSDEGICEVDLCPDVTIEVPLVPPNVMLVLDKSGSMVTNTWDHDGDPGTAERTRWDSLHAVVEAVVAGYDGSMNLGMTLFPAKKAKAEYNVNACVVDEAPAVAVAPQNGAAVLASMPPADATGAMIAGGTPTRAGVQVAIDHLTGLGDALEDVIILVTDGAANCSPDAVDEATRFEAYDQALAGLVADAAAGGIPTFVVGVDIEDVLSPTQPDGNPDATNTFERLNELALAGGVPKEGDEGELFYNARDQSELQAALDKIVMEVLPCDLALDPPAKLPLYVKDVQVDGVSFDDQLESCDAGDGWVFATPERDRLLLCGAACAAFQASGAVTVEYGCVAP